MKLKEIELLRLKLITSIILRKKYMSSCVEEYHEESWQKYDMSIKIFHFINKII